jgi:hypothetical protein
MIVRTITVAVFSDKHSRIPKGTVIPNYGGGVGRRERLKPVEVSADWPSVEVSDPVHESVRRYVINLRDAIGDASIRSAAVRTEVNYSTLHAVLLGQAWPDAITVARTERGLGARLWDGPVILPEDGSAE